jgi:FtsP/CotA-like multicopper oxidase with cupredoxin domain
MQDTQVVSLTNSKIMQQIGTDGGLLAQSVPLDENGLILAPAERADLIVDFSQFPPALIFAGLISRLLLLVVNL